MAMKFAMFYEIPVPDPWSREKEHQAYLDTIEQVKLATAPLSWKLERG